MAVDIDEAITRKIGPFPAWVYGALVLGGVWAVYLWRKRTSTEDQPSLADEVGIGASTEDFSGHLEDTGLDNVGTGTGGESTTTEGKPTNNAQWLAAAITYLSNAFGYDRDEVATAVYAYLRGATLSVAQWVIVNLARGHLGEPPEGTAPPSNSGNGPPDSDDPDPDPTPSPKPKPKPDPKKPDPKPKKTGRYVTVTKWPSRDSTLWGIASHYLGNGNKWHGIWSDPKNAAVVKLRKRPESIRAGDKFWVD